MQVTEYEIVRLGYADLATCLREIAGGTIDKFCGAQLVHDFRRPCRRQL